MRKVRRKSREVPFYTARNDPNTYKRIVQYNSYLHYLLSRVGEKDPRLLKNFGVMLVQGSDGRIYAILHPYLHSERSPKVTLLGALKFFSLVQQSVQEVSAKPPGRIILSYPYHKLVAPDGFELLAVIPHPFYRQRIPKEELKMGAKRIRIPLPNLNLWLRYWDEEERRLANVLAKYGRKYPGILANSVLESVGAAYVMELLSNGTPVRSVRLVNAKGNEQTEFDLLVIREGPRLDVYEMKASDGLGDPHTVFKRKLDSQYKPVRFLSSFGIPVGYHLVLVGKDARSLEWATDVAKEMLRSHPIPAEKRSVHAVRLHKKGFKPYRVETL